MILSAFVGYGLRQKYLKSRENFINTKLIIALKIVGALLGLTFLIITGFSINKASKICGDKMMIQILLIWLVPFYATYFLFFAGNRICKDNNRRTKKRII